LCGALLRALHNSNPGGQPRSEEAQRQLMFFCNSLRFKSLKTPSPLAQVRSWTAFTPYYAEDVKFRVDELTAPLEDEKTLFSLVVATFPGDYDNFKERLGVLGLDDDAILRDHWKGVQQWASDRTQSLSRCIRGVCLYGSALRLLARLEGHEEQDVERLVQSKFEFLVSCQIFGKMRLAEAGSMDKFKADAIEELILATPDLRVCFVHVPPDPKTEDFASCLVGVDPETGTCRIDYRIKLPGNPIIGEGKPENQNQAVIFARGAYLQTLDMNQDNYMGEAYKMRNLLDCFHSDIVLVGFPEVIFSETHGAVAQFAAIAEFIFQTFQRFMTWPLMVRFHYGHPDVWDKGFTMTNGGVSKASRMLHVAEDFFGGINAIARGGKVIFEEFIECGKGRDMGFTSVNGFEQKISGSSGTISMSRDLFRLHKGMDALRIFSLYFSGPGFFISMMQTAWCVYLYILAHATLAIADLEMYRVYRYFKMTETQTSLSLSKEEGGYYNSIYALQLGLLTVLPLFLKMTVDRGVRDGLEYTMSTLMQGSWAFNIFTMATKAGAKT
jgi:callose synthase